MSFHLVNPVIVGTDFISIGLANIKRHIKHRDRWLQSGKCIELRFISDNQIIFSKIESSAVDKNHLLWTRGAYVCCIYVTAKTKNKYSI